MHEADHAVAGARYAHDAFPAVRAGVDRQQRRIARFLQGRLRLPGCGVQRCAQGLAQCLGMFKHHGLMGAGHDDTLQLGVRQDRIPAQPALVRWRFVVALLVRRHEEVQLERHRKHGVVGLGIAVRDDAVEDVPEVRLRDVGQVGGEQCLRATAFQQCAEILHAGQTGQLGRFGATRTALLPIRKAQLQQLRVMRPVLRGPLRLAATDQGRVPGVEQAQEFDLLIFADQLDGDLVGQYAAERPARQPVRPVRLHGTHGGFQALGQPLDGAQLRLAPAHRGQAVDRDIRVDPGTQLREVAVQAGDFMHQEQRPLAARGPHRNRLVPRPHAVALGHRRQRCDIGMLEQLSERDPAIRLRQQADQANRLQ